MVLSRGKDREEDADLNSFRKIFITGTNDTKIQFFRSLFVGGIATLADMAVMILLKELIHIPIEIATIFGFIFGLTVNYIVSNLWVFAKAKVKNRVLDFAVFAVIGVIGLALTELIMAPFSPDEKGLFGVGFFVQKEIFGGLIPTAQYYIVGKILAVVLVYMWNFFARKLILYRNPA